MNAKTRFRYQANEKPMSGCLYCSKYGVYFKASFFVLTDNALLFHVSQLPDAFKKVATVAYGIN